MACGATHDDSRPAEAVVQPLEGELSDLAPPRSASEERYDELAASRPCTIAQLRAIFAGGLGYTGPESLGTDGQVLRLAAALYENDAFRHELIASNRASKFPTLCLGHFRDQLSEMGTPYPDSWDALPVKLRLVSRAIEALPTSLFVLNPVFVPTPGHIAFAIWNPVSSFAQELVQSPNLVPTAELVTAIIANPGSDFAYFVAKCPNWTPTREIIEAALANPHSSLAAGVGANPNVTPPSELIDAAIASPGSRLAAGIARNVNLSLTPDLIGTAIADCLSDKGGPNP